jgi:hypothetical protein
MLERFDEADAYLEQSHELQMEGRLVVGRALATAFVRVLQLAHLNRSGPSRGDPAEHEARLAEIKQNLAAGHALTEDGAPWLERSADVRVLDRAVTERLAQFSIVPSIPIPEVRTLRIPADGLSVSLADTRIDLSKHENHRRIVSALVRSHASGSLSVDALFVAGWPDTKISMAASRNRLRVVLSQLRAWGLRDILVRDEDGYRLDSNVRIVTD